MHTTKRARRSLGLFNVILATDDPVVAVVLHSATTADEATIAFHQARQRLIQDVVRGELLVVHHHDETRMLLREPLRTDVALLGPIRPHRARIATAPASTSAQPSHDSSAGSHQSGPDAGAVASRSRQLGAQDA